MTLSLKDFLSKYFGVDDLKDALFDISEPISGNKDELIYRLIIRWGKHHRDKYDLLDFLEEETLEKICYNFNLDADGNEDTLRRRIKRARILDSEQSIRITTTQTPRPPAPEFSRPITPSVSSRRNSGRVEEDIARSGTNWTKVGAIIGGIAIAVMIILYVLGSSPTQNNQISNSPISNQNNSAASIQIAGNNQISNSQINVISGSASPKSTAVIQFEDLSTDRAILLPIDFQIPKQENYYEDEIRLIGALPNDGVINAKLAKVDFQQYNDSLFYLYAPYLEQPIPPLLVKAGNLNKTIIFNVLPYYGTSQEYHNRNDTTWYTASIGTATFQFNYSDVQNNFQSFNFTQPLSIKIKSCFDNETKPIPCK